MARQDFQTTGGGRKDAPRRSLPGLLARYKPQLVICALVVALLLGGAYYSSRASESVPKTVYSTSLDEAKKEAQAPLVVDINSAEAKELDELPGVGPSTAENIIDHRRRNGSFKKLEDLSSVRKYENGELRFDALLTEDNVELELVRV